MSLVTYCIAKNPTLHRKNEVGQDEHAEQMNLFGRVLANECHKNVLKKR